MEISTAALPDEKVEAANRARKAGLRLLELMRNPAEATRGLARIAMRKIQRNPVPQRNWNAVNQLLARLAETEDGRTAQAWASVGRVPLEGAEPCASSG